MILFVNGTCCGACFLHCQLLHFWLPAHPCLNHKFADQRCSSKTPSYICESTRLAKWPTLLQKNMLFTAELTKSARSSTSTDAVPIGPRHCCVLCFSPRPYKHECPALPQRWEDGQTISFNPPAEPNATVSRSTRHRRLAWWLVMLVCRGCSARMTS